MLTDKQYRILTAENHITLQLTGSLDVVNERQFLEKFSVYFKAPHPHIIINCEHVFSIGQPWYRLLMQLRTMASKVDKKIFLILASENLKSEIKKNGLDKALITKKNLKEALAAIGVGTQKQLDTDFINPFLTATMHVLEVQASVDAIAQSIFIKKDCDKFQGDISGVIGIISETFTGSVVISFSEATFLNIMSSMLGEEIKEITKETSDGAGELTNMIFGQAKISLNEKGYGIKTAIPSVVTGRNHSLTTLTAGTTVVIPFKSNVGDFFIEICLST